MRRFIRLSSNGTCPVTRRAALAIALISAASGSAYLEAAPVSARTSPTARHEVVDINHLPLGDGKISVTPKRGYVMSCRLGAARRGGAQHGGPWIHGNTWSFIAKLHVQGDVTWPRAEFSIRSVHDGTNNIRLIQGNGLPVETPTGRFPISMTDPAYRFDRNPNSVRPYNLTLRLPLNPGEAASPSCVPMGIVGVALNGVAIFNALDAGGRDAMAHEVQDLCDGHPQGAGIYHYHGPSRCLPGETEDDKLIGYAIDGFGIYSMYDSRGRELTDADLDACHGRVSTVTWDGKRVAVYHYVLTREYPYTIGCFRGTPVIQQQLADGRRPRFGRGRRRQLRSPTD